MDPGLDGLNRLGVAAAADFLSDGGKRVGMGDFDRVGMTVGAAENGVSGCRELGGVYEQGLAVFLDKVIAPMTGETGIFFDLLGKLRRQWPCEDQYGKP